MLATVAPRERLGGGIKHERSLLDLPAGELYGRLGKLRSAQGNLILAALGCDERPFTAGQRLIEAIQFVEYVGRAHQGVGTQPLHDGRAGQLVEVGQRSLVGDQGCGGLTALLVVAQRSFKVFLDPI